MPMNVRIRIAAAAGCLPAALLAAGCGTQSVNATGASGHGPRAIAVITLITWVLTASIGAYMLTRWVGSGGVRRHRDRREGLGPAMIFGHMGGALTGLAVWVSYVISGWTPLAWAAVFVLMPVIGFGLSTVTLWVPYPTPGGPGPAGGRLAAPRPDVIATRVSDTTLTEALTDTELASRLVEEVLASLPAAPAPRRRVKGQVAALVPAGHGVLAFTTFLLAVLTAVTALVPR
jgi:hypothetical protein